MLGLYLTLMLATLPIRDTIYLGHLSSDRSVIQKISAIHQATKKENRTEISLPSLLIFIHQNSNLPSCVYKYTPIVNSRVRCARAT
jgi:hypothetical protein